MNILRQRAILTRCLNPPRKFERKECCAVIEGLYHIGVYTKNIERSMEFYIEILGFDKEWQGIVNHPTMGKIPVAVVKKGNCIIELVQPSDAKLVSQQAGPVQHVALRVSDIDKVVKLLKSKGVNFTPDYIEEIPTFWNGIRHTFIYGPSGERIELVEEL
ncbi:VOC family protein [Caldicoprobacter guelmensis]|uniref:VOC family protein n=1 Tax=Caldicoprobacter guelmensis TaxID=1170224 RepID=UPI001FB0453B|nr:VOC family protein [Caldicoprobacter guelmensis]